MQSVIGALRVILGLDTAAFEQGFNQAQKQMTGFGKSMEKLGSKLEGIGAKLSLRVTAPIAAIGAASYKAGVESAEAFAQVESALKSMGGASGKTAQELQKAAKVLEHISTFDDDDILKSVTANMLTFGNIAGPVFDRAQLAVVNLSARLGKDLQSSAIQVGKALNDPVQGLSALTRLGIQFTEQQKEQIKAMVEAGNVAGAQNMILGELEKRFGGAAAAARAASPTAAMAEAWRNLTETIGALVIQVLPPLTSALTSILNWFTALSPETQKWILIIGGAAAVIGPVVAAIGGMITVVGSLATAISVAMPVLSALSAFFLTNPIGLAIAGITAAVIAAYEAWKHWDEIKAVAKAVYDAVKTWLLDKLGAAFKWVQDKIAAVTEAFRTMYDKVVGHSYVPDMVDGIEQEFGRLGDVMVAPAEQAAKEAAEAFAGISGPDVPRASDNLRSSFRDAFSGGLKEALRGRDLGSYFENFFLDRASSALNGLIDNVFGSVFGGGFGGNGGIFGGGGIIGGGMSLLGDLFGFQTGGSFTVGGSGGADSQAVAFRATPGEMVNVTKGVANDNAGSPRIVIQNFGTSKNFEQYATRDEVRIIARDEDRKNIGHLTGKEASNPNSPMRKALSGGTNLQRKIAG